MASFNGQPAIDNRQSPGAIIFVAMALMAIGVVMVASTSASLDRSLFATGWIRTPFGRQIVFAAVGLLLIIVISRAAVPLLNSPTVRWWVPRGLFVLTLAFLVAALIPGLGHVQHGSGRWLRLGLSGIDMGFQPSEPAKLVLVALLASLLTCGTGLRPANRTGCQPLDHVDPRSFRHGFLPAAIALGVCVLLVGKEDFGTSVLLGGVGGSMLFVAGCRLRHLGGAAVLGACALIGLLYSAPYRVARLAAFRDLWGDPQGAGYQPIQSLAAIASGGWFGTGLGSGIQKHGYLPECRSDFIFAVMCEEMGTLGGVLVLALFSLFVFLGIRTMLAAPTRFERLLAFGLTATIGVQAAMNVAVVTVLAPTTGIPLPLISAGGSGMLTSCGAVGVLAAIAARAGAASHEPRYYGAAET